MKEETQSNIKFESKIREYILYYKFLIEYILNDDLSVDEKNELLTKKLQNNTPALIKEYSLDFLIKDSMRISNVDDMKKLEVVERLSKNMRVLINLVANLDFENGITDSLNHYGYLKTTFHVG